MVDWGGTLVRPSFSSSLRSASSACLACTLSFRPSFSNPLRVVVEDIRAGGGWGGASESTKADDARTCSFPSSSLPNLRVSGSVRPPLLSFPLQENLTLNSTDSFIVFWQISVLKGRADLSFRLRGSLASGRIYFTSIRPTPTSAFHVIRFKLILDSPEGVEKGEEVDLRREMQGKGYDLEEGEVEGVLGQLLGVSEEGEARRENLV